MASKIGRLIWMALAWVVVIGSLAAVVYVFILAVHHGATVGAALLATGATVGGAWLVRYFERRRVMDDVRRKEIGPLYLELAAVLAGQESTARKREKIILDFQRKCLLYSSAGTLKAFRTWLRALPDGDEDWPPDVARENTLRFEAFVKEMRRDLGISNWQLQDGDLARTVLSDFE
jgi:hypothetical protein